MRNKLLIILSVVGVLIASLAAYWMGIKNKSLPPAYKPASNPFQDGIYANGIIETVQKSGENTNVYSEVPGTITEVLVKDGDIVTPGTTLFSIEDSIQKATVSAQEAQVRSAKAQYKTASDSYLKLLHAWQIDHGAVSQDNLDTAKNTLDVASANLEVAEQQFHSGSHLLKKYHVKALYSGRVLTINAAVGDYVTNQGVYNSYTQQYLPVITMGPSGGQLSVRCFIDEILIPRLPQSNQINAYMFIRGTDTKIPLQFGRILPMVTPKIELSNQRTERVDVRVLPVLFNFTSPKDITLYPGQLVDVYIGAQQNANSSMPTHHD